MSKLIKVAQERIDSVQSPCKEALEALADLQSLEEQVKGQGPIGLATNDASILQMHPNDVDTSSAYCYSIPQTDIVEIIDLAARTAQADPSNQRENRKLCDETQTCVLLYLSPQISGEFHACLSN